MKRNESLLDLLMELELLDRVPRSGFLLRGVPDPESVADHTFHVTFLVRVLGAQIPGIDISRALDLALVHDLAEVRTGDLPMTATRYLPDGAKASAEKGALEELLAPLGELSTTLASEIAERSTPEARLVKACDKLQLMLKVSTYQNQGAGGLAEFWQNEANFPSDEFEPVRRLFEELRSAQGESNRP